MSKKIKKFIIFLILTGFIVLLSTFGFRFSKNPLNFPIKENLQLARELEYFVKELSFEIGDRSVFRYGQLNKAADFITETFKSFGYDVGFQTYDFCGREIKNIIAVKKGSVNPDAFVIVGVHYDTYFNPGADDNASGVAATLELAKLLAQAPTKRSIKFVAFVNEETPFYKSRFSGSKFYIKEAKEKDENIRAVIIIDMIGYYSEELFSQHYPPVILGLFYPSRGNFVGVYSNWDSRQLKKRIMSGFKKVSRFPIYGISVASFSGVGFSDQVPFWLADYCAVLITDSAKYRNPNYHGDKAQRSDTYQTLDYQRFAEVVRGLKTAVQNIAN